jgi:hypothetical protein
LCTVGTRGGCVHCGVKLYLSPCSLQQFFVTATSTLLTGRIFILLVKSWGVLQLLSKRLQSILLSKNRLLYLLLLFFGISVLVSICLHYRLLATFPPILLSLSRRSPTVQVKRTFIISCLLWVVFIPQTDGPWLLSLLFNFMLALV